MHPCLAVPEIIQNVSGQLDEPSAGLSMALTCRAFLEPALDAVWFEVKGFKPLMACLPAGVWRAQKRTTKYVYFEDTLVIYHLKKGRALTNEDLDRYLSFYAPRIKRLALHSADEYLAPELVDALATATNGTLGALAPRLTALSLPSTTQLEAVFKPKRASKKNPPPVYPALALAKLYLTKNIRALDGGSEASTEDCSNASPALIESCLQLLGDADNLTRVGAAWPVVRARRRHEPSDCDLGETLSLAPLYAFTKLRFLKLCFPKGFKIMSGDVEDMIGAWPEMRVLDLLSSGLIWQTPTLKHTDVVRLAGGLPALRTLGIRFDGTRIPDSPNAEQQGSTTNFGLKTPKVGESFISSPSRVAKWVKASFPGPRYMDTWCLEPDPGDIESYTMSHRRWMDIAEELELEDED